MRKSLIVALAAQLAVFGTIAALAQVKISQEPAGIALSGPELLLGVQQGKTVAFTAQQLKDFILGGGTPAGTVTSVGITMPTNTFAVTNSPVTSSGTLTAILNTQPANSIFAGPSSGVNAQPSWRTMVSADLPASPQFSGVGNFVGGVAAHVCVMTSGATYTVDAGSVCTGQDYLVCVNKTSGSATGITLPTSPTVGREIVVKDCKGDAATNNITITPTGGALVEGAASLIINVNKQSVTLTYDGTNWDAI